MAEPHFVIGDARKRYIAEALIKDLDANTLQEKSSLPANWALLKGIERNVPGDNRTTQQFVLDSVLEDFDSDDYVDDGDLLEAIKSSLSDIMDMTLPSPLVTPNGSSSGSASESTSSIDSSDDDAAARDRKNTRQYGDNCGKPTLEDSDTRTDVHASGSDSKKLSSSTSQ